MLSRVRFVLQSVGGMNKFCDALFQRVQSLQQRAAMLSFTLLRLLAGTGHVKVMAEDEWAHIVLLAALSFTDDTALLKKSVVPELLVGCSSYLP